MADNRIFPDISFVDTDTERLVNAMIRAYETITKRRLFPADPARLFILWIADIIIQERIIINESAKQNVPRFAEGEYLDSIAEIFKDVYRLPAQAARTTMRFELSAARTSAQTIPQGTRVTVDGEIIFETLEVCTIPPGQISGEAAAICQTAGTIGNGFLPGQITQVIDIYPFYERAENITASSGGADRENDIAFYERMRDSMETFSTAGPLGAYIYWTKTASVKIADVKPTSPTPGVVDIRVLLDNGELPDEEMLQLVHDTLSAENIRPFTDLVQVKAPDKIEFDIDLTYYAPRQAQSSTIERQVEIRNLIFVSYYYFW